MKNMMDQDRSRGIHAEVSGVKSADDVDAFGLSGQPVQRRPHPLSR